MNQSIKKEAEGYYQAMADKNIQGLEKHLHPEVQFINPLGETQGKKAYLESTQYFMSLFNALKMRESFASSDKAVIIYDVEFPMATIRTSSLITFQDGLITKIELFYDASPFKK